jgi:hypothetical protein
MYSLKTIARPGDLTEPEDDLTGMMTIGRYGTSVEAIAEAVRRGSAEVPMFVHDD